MPLRAHTALPQPRDRRESAGRSVHRRARAVPLQIPRSRGRDETVARPAIVRDVQVPALARALMAPDETCAYAAPPLRENLHSARLAAPAPRWHRVDWYRDARPAHRPRARAPD